MRHVIQTLSQTTMEINIKSISFEKVEWIMPIIQIPMDWLQNEWITWELLICPCKSHTGYFRHFWKSTPCISVIKQEFNSKTDACYTMISNRIPLLETGEFPAQMGSNAENVSIWWRHHEYALPICKCFSCCVLRYSLTVIWWWKLGNKDLMSYIISAD